MFIIKNIFFTIITFFIILTPLIADIGGVVFQDLPVNNNTQNTYGIKDVNELGVQGVKVTAYPGNNSTFTDANGSWSLTANTNSRIEFSNIPSYLKESVNANVNNSSIQFITNDTTTVSFGVHNPANYSQTTNPLYVTNLQQNGTHIGSSMQNLFTAPYNASELNANFQTFNGKQGTGYIAQDTILMDKLGSVWGKAYQKNKKRLFIASMLQRHIGFAQSPAHIYVSDYSSGNPSTFLGSFSLQGKTTLHGGTINLGNVDRISGPDYTLLNDPALPNIDFDAYEKVAKMSYGGISLDHSSNTLWIMNLKQKAIISLDVSGDFDSLNNAQVEQYLIENLVDVPTCTNGELRPWALKVHEGKGYIGAVCNALVSKSINDLSAHIFSFDLNNPSLGFTQELNFDLNYTRQISNWKAWEDSFFDPTHPTAFLGSIYAQPILSDIEFDKHNNMYIAFFDRYATQVTAGQYRAIKGQTQLETSLNYGEILKVCNNNGLYEKEGTGNCLVSNYNNLGIPEFFNDQGGDRNRESSLGSLAQLKGSNELLLTTVDPHPENTTGRTIEDYWFTQGTHTLSTQKGSIQNWYAPAYTGLRGLTGKANGIGDIEFITNPAPIEIGDRVWLDSNSNGIQDANETGISGVIIKLVCNDTMVSSATTNSSGHYIFSNDTSAISTSSHRYDIISLVENSNQCYIQIPNITGSNKQAALNTKELTISNIGEGSNKTLNDSNGIVDNNNSKLLVLSSDIPIAGHNNHSFDIGFKPQVILFHLGDRVWLDSNKDGIQDTNESGVHGITVDLYNNDDCSGTIIQSTETTNNGLYQFNNLSTGNYCIAFRNLPVNHLISPNNQGTDGSLDSDANSNAQITNINLIKNNLTYDLGIYANPPVIVQPTVQIGNRVWIESDNDGNANTGTITSLIGQTVTATSSNGTPYSAVTDSNGLYLITVPQNDIYLVTLDIPNNHVATGNSDDNNISENVLEDNLSHDSRGTTVTITTVDNLTVDFGFRRIIVLGSTVCQEMIVNDDVQNANELNATTTIDVLNNDTGSKSGQEIKFLSLSEGRTLWESGAQNISSATTLDTLTVAGEGTWSVVDNKVVFTALTSFDGQIPTPVYYIIKGADCTVATQFSNVAQVTIDTPCNCPTYSTKSVATLNFISILLLILFSISITLFNIKKELTSI